MPSMTSPDNTETLEIPESGVPTMKALGWTVAGGGKYQPQSDEGTDDKPVKRGPRSRKTE